MKIQPKKKLLLHLLSALVSLGLCFFSIRVLALYENEDTSTSIPNNGSYNSDEDYPSSPTVYASILRENMKCLDPQCEEKIMVELQMYFMNDVEDAYRAYLLGAVSDGGHFNDYIYKIQGIKVLKDFLRLHHFDKAAQFVSAKLTAPNPKICIGMEPSLENPGQYERECNYKENANCEKKCMEQSLEQLAGQILDSDRRSQALDALNDSNLKIHNSVLGICSVKNPDSKKAQSQISVAPQAGQTVQNKDRANLCGIIDSPSVIQALAGPGGHFIGGSLNDPAEYSCSYVRIHLDKAQNPWRMHPDELNHNYVVHPDGKPYKLTAEDVQALQQEVERLTKYKSPMAKIITTKSGTPVYDSQR